MLYACLLCTGFSFFLSYSVIAASHGTTQNVNLCIVLVVDFLTLGLRPVLDKTVFNLTCFLSRSVDDSAAPL